MKRSGLSSRCRRIGLRLRHDRRVTGADIEFWLRTVIETEFSRVRVPMFHARCFWLTGFYRKWKTHPLEK